mgnify:CR=1 FL=1
MVFLPIMNDSLRPEIKTFEIMEETWLHWTLRSSYPKIQKKTTALTIRPWKYLPLYTCKHGKRVCHVFQIEGFPFKDLLKHVGQVDIACLVQEDSGIYCTGFCQFNICFLFKSFVHHDKCVLWWEYDNGIRGGINNLGVKTLNRAGHFKFLNWWSGCSDVFSGVFSRSGNPLKWCSLVFSHTCIHFFSGPQKGAEICHCRPMTDTSIFYR